MDRRRDSIQRLAYTLQKEEEEEERRRSEDSVVRVTQGYLVEVWEGDSNRSRLGMRIVLELMLGAREFKCNLV